MKQLKTIIRSMCGIEGVNNTAIGREPFEMDGKIYATNGYMMLAIPKEHVGKHNYRVATFESVKKVLAKEFGRIGFIISTDLLELNSKTYLDVKIHGQWFDIDYLQPLIDLTSLFNIASYDVYRFDNHTLFRCDYFDYHIMRKLGASQYEIKTLKLKEVL